MIPTKEQLEDGRCVGFRKYDYFYSFCEYNSSCEECDKIIRIGCVMKRKIEKLQTKRILRICKSEPPKEEKGKNYVDVMIDAGLTCKACYFSKEWCNDESAICEDETGLCKRFDPVD